MKYKTRWRQASSCDFNINMINMINMINNNLFSTINSAGVLNMLNKE